MIVGKCAARREELLPDLATTLSENFTSGTLYLYLLYIQKWRIPRHPRLIPEVPRALGRICVTIILYATVGISRHQHNTTRNTQVYTATSNQLSLTSDSEISPATSMISPSSMRC